MHDAARARLTRVERWGVIFSLALLVGFGALVEMRSALLSRRMGDLGCYLRGAWAVRAGTNLYEITDDNDWHYNYPPFFAIMLVPLADPPAGQSGAWVVPFALTAGLWYVANVLCLLWAIHVLARALEETSADPQIRDQPRFCRRWWALRLWPALVCLVPIGHTLMRGQVNLLILAMLCSMTACLLRGRSFRAGLWLALASAIKVIPVFLLVYPLARRDWRCLTGSAVGLLATLVVIPVLALGPAETVANYRVFARTLLGPALRLSDDMSRHDELLGSKSTDNQSLQNALFNAWYPNSRTRPPHVEPWAAWAHRVLAIVLTGITLLAGYRAGFRAGVPLALLLAALMFLMVVLGPVCHLHYFTNLVPLVTVLMAQRWQRRAELWLGGVLCMFFGVFVLVSVLPHVPALENVRDLGLPLYGGLGLWLLAILGLWRSVSSDVPAWFGPWPIFESLRAKSVSEGPRVC